MLDLQMVGRLARTVVPDILYLEYKSLYLEVKAFGAAVAGRAAMERRPYRGRVATCCDRNGQAARCTMQGWGVLRRDRLTSARHSHEQLQQRLVGHGILLEQRI